MKVVTVTVKPSLDTTVTVDRMEPNKKLSVSSVKRAPGGGGINVARALNELGTHARAVWLRGGGMGALVAKMLDDEDVPNDSVKTDGETGQSIAVIEEATRDHYRLSTQGAPMTETNARDLAGLIGSPEWVVVSGGLPTDSPPEAYSQLVSSARDVGAKVIVDTHDEALLVALETEAVFLIKPNERELDDVGDRLGISGSSPEQARALIERFGLEAVVVSRGRSGSLLVTIDGVEQVDAPEVEEISRIGAGDSLVAGLTYQLAGGWNLVDAVRYGVAAGSAAVNTPGTDLCRRRQTEGLFESMPGADD